MKLIMMIIQNCNLKNLLITSLILLLLFSGCTHPGNEKYSDLEEGFINPPLSAKPRVWWHWMSGNVTKEGIKKDLEWMNRVGIGGFQNFDASLLTPQIVERRLVYMTPEWKDAFQFATKLADSLHLEMAIASSPGWSESGGPWVNPSEAMKKMVWSETIVEGGTTFKGILSHPSTVTGNFQNLPKPIGISFSDVEEKQIPEYYADAVVIAYKIPDADHSLQDLKPKVTSSGGKFTLKMLTDGDLVTSSFLPSVPGSDVSWIQFEFNQPQTIYSLTMVGGANVNVFGFISSNVKRALEISADGENFKKITDIPAGGVNQNTITFPAANSKYFRISLTESNNKTPNPLEKLFGNKFGKKRTPSGTDIAEIVLHTVPRINCFEKKAGFSVSTDIDELTEQIKPEDAIIKQDVINLTDKVDKNGYLNWTPPQGKWNILRIGYSLTGHNNSPASPEATGLEVDKLNPEYVRNYFNNYLNQYKNATGGLMGEKGLQYILTDSYEAGTANWTDKMIEEFNKRNNYDIIPWLPVLTGKIVESSTASENFLWDFRNTLASMLTEYHYDNLTSILQDRGLGRYSESHEDKRAFIGDGMEVKRSAAIPMGATWIPGKMDSTSSATVQPRFEADVRESASVSHIYGQNIVAAESFTTAENAFGFAPENLKSTADIMLSNGLNRFVIHTSVHQPLDDKIPGLGLGPVGQWFTRHETWAEQAKPWMDYLARSSYMLQQGKFVGDILYVYGQGTNLTWLFRDGMPPVPEGYNYDFLNAGAVPIVLSEKSGSIVTKTGMTYKLLVLDQSTRYMTLPVLKKLEQFVNAGAKVSGPKPINTPSLNDDEVEFRQIANRLWDEGKINAKLSMAEVLNDLHIEPDFNNSKDNSEGSLRFVHRSLGKQDIYWVSTSDKESKTQKISFRINGMEPEIWDPVSGVITPASYFIENNRTVVSLNMEPEDALFVVFRKKNEGKSELIPEHNITHVATISENWVVHFQPDRGAPQTTEFQELSEWNGNENQGIKYFSGTAEYTKSIDVSQRWLTEGTEIWIDLGEVKNLAEVSINGKSQGIVWKKPFKIRIDKSLKTGKNQLSVKITNLWVNRIIGDLQLHVENPVTYTSWAFYKADSPLLPSGLLGPVKLIQISN
jgi:hypothetical protein